MAHASCKGMYPIRIGSDQLTSTGTKYKERENEMSKKKEDWELSGKAFLKKYGGPSLSKAKLKKMREQRKKDKAAFLAHKGPVTVSEFLTKTAQKDKSIKVTKIGTARWEARRAAVNFFYEGIQDIVPEVKYKTRRSLDTNKRLKVTRVLPFVRTGGATDAEINRLYTLLVEFFEKGYKAGTGHKLQKPAELIPELAREVINKSEVGDTTGTAAIINRMGRKR
jgi:hypothetical protein